MKPASPALDAACENIPTRILARYAYKTIPGENVVNPEVIDPSYHIRVKSEEDPEVVVLIFSSDDAIVSSRLGQVKSIDQ